jgi:hypothetical protein
VALFALGAHYTTVIYNRHTNAIAYLNSIHTEVFSTPREVNIIQDLLRDEMKRQQLPIQSTEWTVEFPMVQMEPQQVYHFFFIKKNNIKILQGQTMKENNHPTEQDMQHPLSAAVEQITRAIK